MGKVNPLMRVKINKHVCAVDKKERYFTNVSRASEINDEILINYATEDLLPMVQQSISSAMVSTTKVLKQAANIQAKV